MRVTRMGQLGPGSVDSNLIVALLAKIRGLLYLPSLILGFSNNRPHSAHESFAALSQRCLQCITSALHG